MYVVANFDVSPDFLVASPRSHTVRPNNTRDPDVLGREGRGDHDPGRAGPYHLTTRLPPDGAAPCGGRWPSRMPSRSRHSPLHADRSAQIIGGGGGGGICSREL
uniref:Uncharacterized protein n=1 Tax=Oryza punctata TaxID=4537 RepID=A0A0E0L4Q2_ORYPU